MSMYLELAFCGITGWALVEYNTHYWTYLYPLQISVHYVQACIMEHLGSRYVCDVEYIKNITSS